METRGDAAFSALKITKKASASNSDCSDFEDALSEEDMDIEERAALRC